MYLAHHVASYFISNNFPGCTVVIKPSFDEIIMKMGEKVTYLRTLRESKFVSLHFLGVISGLRYDVSVPSGMHGILRGTFFV